MHRIERLIGQLRQRVERIAHDLQAAPLFSLATLLHALAAVYGGLMVLRAHLYDNGLIKSHRLPCRVVSIGNLVAGGTGKTPMTIFVAQLLNDLGCRVVVLSRGYRSRMEKSGGVVSDGHSILATVEEAGDEPYLMARVLKGVPVVVGRRRYQAGRLAIQAFHPDVIVLDDGFQHLKLKRDLDLVLLDRQRPFGNGYLLPRGILREPLSALRRAHGIVFTRSDESPSAHAPRFPRNMGKPLFYTVHRPVIRRIPFPDETFSVAETADLATLKGKKVIAFAGLANNGQFFSLLRQYGGMVVRRRDFADHHRYTAREIDSLMETARSAGIDGVVTTMKDYVKIASFGPWPVELIVVDVKIDLRAAISDFRRFMVDFRFCTGASERNSQVRF